MQRSPPVGKTRAAWLSLSIPDVLHSPRNTFSLCLKLNLADATRSYKNIGMNILRDYTGRCFSPLPCVGKVYLLWYRSQMEYSTFCLPGIGLPKFPDRSASFHSTAEQSCFPAWSARSVFLEAHLHVLALMKGRNY